MIVGLVTREQNDIVRHQLHHRFQKPVLSREVVLQQFMINHNIIRIGMKTLM